MESMEISRLEYIKNVNAEAGWAYEPYPVSSYFPLNFKRGDGVEAHVAKLSKGSLVILSQKPPSQSKRYLTHVVKICNEHHEDKTQWDVGPWGIIRWTKVCWTADFQNLDTMPINQDVMQAEWGWYDTKAKLLESPKLMEKWGNIDTLRVHLKKIFI